MKKQFRRGYILNDWDGDFPPEIERDAKDSELRATIDGEGNLVVDSTVYGQTVIFHIPIEAIIELTNLHAEWVNKLGKKKT